MTDTTTDRPFLLCFGMGFSAMALVELLDRSQWRIAATATTAEKAERISKRYGIEASVFDGSAPSQGVRQALQQATHILVSAPPDEAGDPVLLHHAADIVGAPHLAWIGYLSTIGVYGDHKGGWLDETTPENPMQGRSRWRRDAEIAWQRLGADRGTKCVLFRLAGIYGPGRSAIENVRSGRARRIIKPGQKFNRIHVEDIAAVVHASMQGRGAFDIYNLADDEPSPPEDVIVHAASLLGMPTPPAIPFDDPSISEMQRSFYSESKLVRNDRIKHDLGVRLAYPTYREGLAAIAGRFQKA